LASSLDLFPTILNLAGLPLPADRIIDGKDLRPLLRDPEAPSPHSFVVSMHHDRLMTIHSGPWKLHVRAQRAYRPPRDLSTWKDARGPDGVTLIAPFEQYTPASYPGLTSGAESKAGALFHVANDPGEQVDVGAQHAEVVQRLRSYAETVMAEMPTLKPPKATGKVQRITGGRLDFWNDPKVP
jgi:arylsulfatase A-like enzyme